MNIKSSMAELSIKKAVDYIGKEPEKNMIKVMDFIDSIAGEGPQSLPGPRKEVRKIIEDKNNPYHPYLIRLFTEIDTEVAKKLFVNFVVNANFNVTNLQDELRAKYNCNIPWAILLDPTSACNLHCIGCWAAEYGNKLNLTFDEIDSIIEQGKKLGCYFYIYTGGEPLVRKKDLMAICRKHNDCEFLSFTNGTLIDEDFADEMLEVKNFVPAISVEGSEETTDSRRGKGTYSRARKAMEILKSKKLPFGISCCYTSVNYKAITDEQYFQDMINWGAYFVWYFHYMPVGNDASPILLPNPEQREYVYNKLRDNRSKYGLFTMDFQNDAEYVGGCIAGGRSYLHINANGDVDPCVFIHYSDSNIREKSLLECLQAPLFKAYHDGQPFNHNMLRPCPMLENPQKLVDMVNKTKAHSTDPQSPETVEHLCGKCREYAANWLPTARRLWEQSHPEDKED